ncbi:unnamed protein product [Cochlearia groenlandica]
MPYSRGPIVHGYVAAMSCFTTKSSSGNGKFWNCLYGMGNYTNAILCYNEVLRIDPLAADALVNRGNTYTEIRRVSEAIQDYMHAIAFGLEWLKLMLTLPWLTRIGIHSMYSAFIIGHVEAAITSYKQALHLVECPKFDIKSLFIHFIDS